MKAPRPSSPQDLFSQLLVEGKRDRSLHKFAQHTTTIVVLGRTLPYLAASRPHPSILSMLLVVSSLCGIHRLYPMAEREMQHIAIIPLES